ncbi:NAD-dependent succinate-semialdehyde dehydrogenase [Paraburkholderia aspalathi]|uniref:NAD-dependent succinate-semialdehyde dehydrogenase n=1 Tax=Paraburkholderia aspalathi TaxID=1324617 RepID=UPI003CB54257
MDELVENRLTEYPDLKLLIDGVWASVDTRASIAVTNPATGEVLGFVPVATQQDLQMAVEAASKAFAHWKKRTAFDRSRILRRIADLVRERKDRLAVILTLEQGKTLAESQGELTAVADTFDWMAEEGRRVYGRIVPSRFPNVEQMVICEPIGVVAALSPWNYPAALGARKVATALAAGCTVVLKPAEETPGIWVALAELCVDAGVPNGVLNLVFGNPSEISDFLLSHPAVKKVSFTGSIPVGLMLAEKAARSLKKITLELGGHSPVFLAEDAKPEHVARLAVASKFRNAGQICHSPTRFFIHSKIYQRFVESFVEGASALKVGNGLHRGVQMGPLANGRRVKAMEDLVADAKQNGSRILTGGERCSDDRGHFWKPTVIEDLSENVRLLREEPFGPIALMIPFDSIEDAVIKANQLSVGLGSFAFTNSISVAKYLQDNVEAGSLSINTFAITPPEVPFGGWKLSGAGSEMGSEGLIEHFNIKTVLRTEV